MNDRDGEPDVEDVENQRAAAHAAFVAKSNEIRSAYESAASPLRAARDAALDAAYREFCEACGYGTLGGW